MVRVLRSECGIRLPSVLILFERVSGLDAHHSPLSSNWFQGTIAQVSFGYWRWGKRFNTEDTEIGPQRARRRRNAVSGRRIWRQGRLGRGLGIPLWRGGRRRRLLGGCRRLAGIADLVGDGLWEFCGRIAGRPRLVRGAWPGRGRLGNRWRCLSAR